MSNVAAALTRACKARLPSPWTDRERDQKWTPRRRLVDDDQAAQLRIFVLSELSVAESLAHLANDFVDPAVL